MKWLRELFSESSRVSAMRVMAMVSLFAAIGLAFTGHDTSVMVFVTAAFSGKVSQKFLETRNGSSKTETDAKISSSSSSS